MNDIMVRFVNFTATICVRPQPVARIHWMGTVVETVFWRRCTRWMVCYSDRKYLYLRLLPTITNILSQNDENSWNHLQQNNLDIPFWQIYQYLRLCSLPVLYCTTTVLLYCLELEHQCCIVTYVASLKYRI